MSWMFYEFTKRECDGFQRCCVLCNMSSYINKWILIKFLRAKLSSLRFGIVVHKCLSAAESVYKAHYYAFRQVFLLFPRALKSLKLKQRNVFQTLHVHKFSIFARSMPTFENLTALIFTTKWGRALSHPHLWVYVVRPSTLSENYFISPKKIIIFCMNCFRICHAMAKLE